MRWHLVFRVDRESGFGLVSALVALSVMSVMALSLLSLMKNQFHANAAVQWDLDVYTFRRNIVSQSDCAETYNRVGRFAAKGKSVPVDLYTAPSSHSGGQPRRILEGRPEGTPFGSNLVFRFRADLRDDGIHLMARSEQPGGKGPARHPVLGVNHKWKDWASASPGNMPLCTPEQGRGTAGSESTKEFTAELVLTRQSKLVAKDGDINVAALHAVDGGGDCQNTLVLTCDLAAGRRVFELGREDSRASFALAKDRSCDVTVVSRLRSGSGSCKGGYLTGLRPSGSTGAATLSSDNALTMQQGWSSYRVQWEDRLAYADDGKKCAGGKGDQLACDRLRAMDWNDGIWLIEGTPAQTLGNPAPEGVRAARR